MKDTEGHKIIGEYVHFKEKDIVSLKKGLEHIYDYIDDFYGPYSPKMNNYKGDLSVAIISKIIRKRIFFNRRYDVLYIDGWYYPSFFFEIPNAKEKLRSILGNSPIICQTIFY